MTSFCANENSKLCNDCGHWAECPECGVCGLCRLYDPPSEQRTYCLKHYRQTFPGKGCDMCEMEARIEALEKAARLYLEGAAHSTGCWAYRAMGNNITHRPCMCGHDALAALLQE